MRDGLLWVMAIGVVEATPLRPFLQRNCVGCHTGPQAQAGLDLAALAEDGNDAETYARWVRVHDAVRSGAMPPKAAPAVAAADKAAFVTALHARLVATGQQRVTAHGRAVLRRLNRYEYENTVRDILRAPWLELRDSLPEDGIVQRFNKSGQALDVSHVQMARYLETAEQALRLVREAAAAPEQNRRYYAREQKRFLNRMRYSSFNRHPERATIPILGFAAQPDVLAERVPITVGESNPAVRELEGFATPASTYVGNEYHFDQFAAPAGGRYRLRFHAYSLWIHTVLGPPAAKDRAPWWRPNREKTERGRTVEPVTIYALRPGGEKRLLGSFDVTPEPGVHELDVDLLPGEMILPDAARLFRSRPGFTGSPDATQKGMPGVAYRWMEVRGPVADTGAQETVQQLFAGGNAEQSMRAFLARAYRRPATDAEFRRYLGIAARRLAAGAEFAEAMTAGYTAVLCSPGFLYFEEAPGRLSGDALASRLSYFLWNGPPDTALRAAAADGSLLQPAVLRAQTNRLLNDPRARQFLDSFLDYWLDLRKLGDTTPDQTLYPEYYLDDLLQESADQETRLFFAHLLRENLPVANLIDARFTYLNAHLARHYGLPAVDGVAMRRVDLPADSVRGGLLTMASVLKVTANGTTTSPVLRGVWIMERILGDPPPPPPPNVPAVEPDTRGATTIRQQLDQHRSIPACAGCHNKIDPPGFALESFDVLGAFRRRYRSTEEGEPVQGIGKNGHAFTFRLAQPVDASGTLAAGGAFRDVVELKRLLRKDERAIARNMVQQWIVYATGAPVGFADRAEVERILDAAAPDRYGLRTIVHQVIASRLFREK